MRTLSILLLLASPALAQGIGGNASLGGKGGIGGGTTPAITWSFKSIACGGMTSGCTGGTESCAGTTCTLTLSTPTVAGDSLIVGYFNPPGATVSSPTGDSAWTKCTSPTCTVSDAGVGQWDAYYIANATGGASTITCNEPTQPGWFCRLYVIHKSSGTPVFDTSGSIDDASCTSCSGVALTLTGSNDGIVQMAVGANPITAVTTYGNTNFLNDFGMASLLTTSSGTAPTWTQSSAGAAVGIAIAFK